MTGTDRLLVEGAAVVLVQSDSHVLFGGDIAIGGRPVSGLFVFGGITFFTPTEDKRAGVTLKINRFPVKLGGRFAFSLGRIALGPSLALSFDPIIKSITIHDTERLDERNEETEWKTSLTPLFFTTIRVSRPIHILAAAGVKVLLNERDFVLENADGSRETIHHSWLFQPAIYLGLSLVLL